MRPEEPSKLNQDGARWLTMTGKEALTLVDTLLQAANLGQRLNDVQSVVFLGTWEGRSYRDIAQQLGYQHDYIKQVGSQLWR
jgi:DNA-directed RNA polymerase specialized sigma24 family protein